MKIGTVKSINDTEGIGEILGEDDVVYGFDVDEVKALKLEVGDEVTFDDVAVPFANEFVAVNIKL